MFESPPFKRLNPISLGPKYLPPGPATTLATLARLLHCRLPPSPNMPVSDLCLFHISLLEGSSPSQACPTYVSQLSSTRVSCRKYSCYDNCVPGGALSVSWGLHMTSMPRASKPLLPSHVSASGRKPWCHFFQTSVVLTKRPCTYQVADKETCSVGIGTTFVLTPSSVLRQAQCLPAHSAIQDYYGLEYIRFRLEG